MKNAGKKDHSPTPLRMVIEEENPASKLVGETSVGDRGQGVDKSREKSGVEANKRVRKPSHRALKYVDNLTKGMSKKDAALDAGYSKETADNPKVIEKTDAVNELLIAAGVTYENLVKKLEEGLRATKLYGKEAIEHPDYKARIEYIKTCFRLLGVETEKPSVIMTNPVIIQGSEIEQLNVAFTQFLGQHYGKRQDTQLSESA